MMTFINFVLIWQSARIDNNLEQSKSESSAIEKASMSINVASEPLSKSSQIRIFSADSQFPWFRNFPNTFLMLFKR